MALTITSPATVYGWMPSGNDLTYSIISTEAYRNGFAYIIDVYVNDNVVIQLRQLPITYNVPIKVNVKDIVSNFISTKYYYTNMAGQKIFAQPPEYAKVYISVTERYSGDDWDTELTYPIFVWNSVAQFRDIKRGTDRFIRNFVPVTSGSIHTDGRPLGVHNVCPMNVFNVVDSSIYVKPEITPYYTLNTHLNPYMSFMTISQYDGVFADYFVFAGLDQNGKMIKKFVNRTDASTDVDGNKQILTTPLNNIYGGNFNYRYGYDTSNFSDCSYMVVYTCESFNADLSTPDTPTLHPVMFRLCNNNESFGVVYKSNEGGWWYIQCNDTATEETSVETTTMMNAELKSLTGSVDIATNNMFGRYITPVDVKAQGTIKVNTGWVDGGIIDDIADMITSPIIYIQHYIDNYVHYIPVTLVDATYVTKESRNRSLRNYEFEFAEAYYKNTIRQ